MVSFERIVSTGFGNFLAEHCQNVHVHPLKFFPLAWHAEHSGLLMIVEGGKTIR